MIERDLYPAVLNGVFAKGGIAYRLHDSHTGKKPFDIGGIAKTGQAIAIEVKIGDGLIEFGKLWKKLPEHQQYWLKEVAKHGGRAHLCYYDRVGRIMKCWQFVWDVNLNDVTYCESTAISGKHAGKRAFLGDW